MNAFPQTWRDALCEHSRMQSGRWVRISVDTAGIYRMSDAWLRKQGFSRPESVHVFGYGACLLSNQFPALPTVDLPLAPQMRQPDGLLFYACGTVSWALSLDHTYFQHTQHPYSTHSYYFLSDVEVTTEMDSLLSMTGKETLRLSSFNEHILHEKDAYSWSASGSQLYDGYDYVNGSNQTYEISLPGLLPEETAFLSAAFTAQAVGTEPTYFDVTLGGIEQFRMTLSPIPVANRSLQHATMSEVHVPLLGTKTSLPKLQAQHSRPTGISGHLDYLSIDYHRKLDLPSNCPSLLFRSVDAIAQKTTFQLTHASPSTLVWNVTTPSHPQVVDGARLQGDTLLWTTQSDTLIEWVAFDSTSTTFPVPVSYGQVPCQDLHALSSADMVIILPTENDFQNDASRLADYHLKHDGFTSVIVTAQQIYNEFSSGTPDAMAIRRFLKMLYDRSGGSSSLHYVLLFGDSSFDNRMLTSSWSKYDPAKFLLSYQSTESLDETSSYVSDDYFTFLDDNEGVNLFEATPDVAIGRIPVRTHSEAQAVVDKIYSYTSDLGDWRMNLSLIADDGDQNLHAMHSEELASLVTYLSPAIRIHRIYADAYKRESTASSSSYPDAHEQILKNLNQGIFVLNYTGHGSSSVLTAENLLTQSDIQSLTNAHLPLWITATCDFTRFDGVDNSAGEDALMNPMGGAIGLFTTTRIVQSSQNTAINKAILRHLYQSPSANLTMGEAMLRAKKDTQIAADRNKLSFTLIGDPALKISRPSLAIQIDSIAGIALTDVDEDNLPRIRAGDEILVSGRVLTAEDAEDANFSGLLFPYVYDSPTTVATLDNLGEGTFTYQDRTRLLYNGVDTVSNSRFHFSFRVPMDICYTNLTGLMSLYAYDSARGIEASGSCSRYIVGGTSDEAFQDTLIPQIRMYLGTEAFHDGDAVNETPCFFASLFDPYGINTTSTGLGHNLTLIVDDSPSMTYDLNSYYTQVVGDYRRGMVGFTLPKMEKGFHTLTFRAWNQLNHMAQSSLTFEVVENLQPTVFDLYCTESPARTSTTFKFRHDRAGSEMTVRLFVYDVMGRLQWNYMAEGVSSSDTYSVVWNLCSSAGTRVTPGVYLYQVVLSVDGIPSVTAARKMLVLPQ